MPHVLSPRLNLTTLWMLAICLTIGLSNPSSNAQPPPAGYRPFNSPQDNGGRYPLPGYENPRPDRPTRQAVPQPNGPVLIAEVQIKGNRTISPTRVRSYLKTRPDREFDSETVQSDVRELINSGLFRNVRTFTELTPRGMVVTFEVFELPTIQYIKFIGNRWIKDKTLLKESGLKKGEALSTFRVDEVAQKLEEFYRSKGYTKSQVSVLEGNRPNDRGIIYVISEDNLQRIWSVDFKGNRLASDQRLKTQIQSKPGYLKYFFGGKLDRRKIEEDVERLTAYYRGLGYFNAKIGRELRFDPSGVWVTLTFMINEGPQYKIRNVSIVGNKQFDGGALAERLALKSDEAFNGAKMQADLNTLLDIYGSQGYIFADIKADPRFLEEPGFLDLMYNVKEGQQYRVGRVNVHIAGQYPHTRLNVIRNRISLQPGDIIDIREIRDSERRLKASQLFVNTPQTGVTPRISVVPPDLQKAASALAGRGDQPRRTANFRGQSPDSEIRTMDLNVELVPKYRWWKFD